MTHDTIIFTRRVWIGEVKRVGRKANVLFRGKRFPRATVLEVNPTELPFFKLVTFGARV